MLFKAKVDLCWFYFTTQQEIHKSVYGKDNQAMLYEESVKKIKFKFPKDITLQKRIAQKYQELSKIHKNILSVMDNVFNLKREVIQYN